MSRLIAYLSMRGSGLSNSVSALDMIRPRVTSKELIGELQPNSYSVTQIIRLPHSSENVSRDPPAPLKQDLSFEIRPAQNEPQEQSGENGELLMSPVFSSPGGAGATDNDRLRAEASLESVGAVRRHGSMIR
jgi:hypothetical protein